MNKTFPYCCSEDKTLLLQNSNFLEEEKKKKVNITVWNAYPQDQKTGYFIETHVCDVSWLTLLSLLKKIKHLFQKKKECVFSFCLLWDTCLVNCIYPNVLHFTLLNHNTTIVHLNSYISPSIPQWVQHHNNVNQLRLTLAPGTPVVSTKKSEKEKSG